MCYLERMEKERIARQGHSFDSFHFLSFGLSVTQASYSLSVDRSFLFVLAEFATTIYSIDTCKEIN